MKHALKIFLLLGAVIAVCLGSLDGGTLRLSSTAMADTCMVGGPITINTTWSTANCDTYVVYGNMSVEPGVTLTIEPGVVVAFQEGYRLDVGGALTARGTVTDSIVFTGWNSDQDPQWWEWIKFKNSSIDIACSLSYCRIEYAEEGVYCDTASPTISHCLIRECRDGIYCYAGLPYIAQNTIMDNHSSSNSSGIYIWGGSPVTFGNVIQQNHYYGIYARPWGSAEPCTSLSITADTIRSNEKYGIRLDGRYSGILSGTIRSCDIYDNPDGGISVVLDEDGGNVRITNNHIHNNTATDGGGIYFEGGYAVIDSNCIFGNRAGNLPNTAGGIYFNSVDSAMVHYNDIVGNSGPTKYAYEVYSGEPSSPDIHGEYNWWGTIDSSAIANLIYDYYDNVDLRKFIFASFATSPHCTTESWIKVTTPNGGECWKIGTTHDLTWDHGSFSDSVIIEYTTNNGTAWDTIADTTTNDGVYPWTIPDTPSDSCLVRISHIGDSIPSDVSDSVFSIAYWCRGDANGDGVINAADVVYLTNYLYIHGPAPLPLPAGDVDCDGTINAADVVYLTNYLYIHGPTPPC
jgi:hypothetical protein